MALPTVYLVDDDEDLLEFLSVALNLADLNVVSYSDALKFLEEAPTVDKKGCVVLDINMPAMNGLDVQQKLKEINFALPIVFLTAHADVPSAVKALQAGAVNFIEKPVQVDELSDAIKQALNIPQAKLPSPEEIEVVRKTVDELTPREREVMELIVQGASNKEAAQSLDISPRTVEIYRATVMRKMESANLPDLVRKAIAIGL